MLDTILTWRWRGIYACLAVFLMLVVFPAWGDENRARNRREREENPRKEKLRQEAQESVSEIKTLLTQILEVTNKNQTPGQELITQAATMIEENKHFVLAYKDDQRAQYMLLQAWTDFYQGNLLDAMNWALRACKMDISNGDAWISQAVFCQLNGKRPLEPRIRKQNSRGERENGENRQPRRRRENEAADNNRYASASEPYGRKGTLDFDLSTLRKEMLKERFARIEYQTRDGSKVEYKPGENTLCIFFWQVEPARTDAEDAAADGADGDVEAMRRPDSGSSPKLSLNSQGQYFSNIYEVLKDHPQITCFSLNTNDLQDAERVATGMDDDFARETMDKPMVFASNPESGAAAFVGVKAQTPFMLIADKEGIVRYAGPAAGFMPAFVLTHLTGIEISLDGSRQAQTQPRQSRGPARELRDDMGQMSERRPRRVTRPKVSKPSVADPNRPAGDPNSVPAAGTNKPAAKPVEMTLEDEIKADKLLALAEVEIGVCRKMPARNPEKGIVACREVLKKYPGTKYAEQARELLRDVPQRYKEKYEITDEELGL